MTAAADNVTLKLRKWLLECATRVDAFLSEDSIEKLTCTLATTENYTIFGRI